MTRALFASLLLVACGDGSNLLVVDLRTDLVPGTEFSQADAVLIADGDSTGAIVTREALDSDNYIRGERLAEYDDIASGTYLAEVRLRDATGAVVAERATRVSVNSGTLAVTVLITRDCRGVMCPGEGDDPSETQCLAGQCVHPDCSPENPEACGMAFCNADADCSFSAPCVTGRCFAGACFAEPNEGACGEDEFCHPESGCEPAGTTCVAGVACDPGEICNRCHGLQHRQPRMSDSRSGKRREALSTGGRRVRRPRNLRWRLHGVSAR